MESAKTFYTYLYLREDGTPYYAGKGKDDRAFSKQHNVPVPKDRSRILIQEFLSEQGAFEAEKFLIAYYGRIDLGTGCLRNLTDGGDGNAGYKHTEAALQRLAEAAKGNKHNLGKTRSELTKCKMSRAHRGVTHTEESREKMRKPKAQPFSEAHRLKLCATRRRKLTDAQVLEIRRRVASETKVSLAREFQVTSTVILRIAQGIRKPNGVSSAVGTAAYTIT